MISERRNKKDRKSHKRIRRSKKIKNKFERCTIMYTNIRELKSKLGSVEEILLEEKPEILGMVETMVDETESIEYNGYKIYRKDRNKDGGGVMLLIKDVLHGIIVEEEESQEDECIWLTMNNGRVNLRIGVIYNPQESRTSKEQLTSIYARIEQQIQRAHAQQQKIIIMGDLNCKVGDMIKGNKQDVTVGGKLLKKILNRNKLIMANNIQMCKGLWTRQSGNEKSVIDYMILNFFFF